MLIIFLRVIYLKSFIRIFYTLIVLYLSKINLFIYLICLFILFIYFIYLINYIIYRKEKVRLEEKVEKSLEENMIKSVIIKKINY